MEQQSNEVYEVVVVGAGISGLATAVALTRLGISNIIVLEKSDSLRSTGTAITLFPNAWCVLDALGVAHKLTDLYDPYDKWHIKNIEDGSRRTFTTTETSPRRKMEARVVHRKALLEALASELPHGIIRFSSKLISIKSEAIKDLERLNYLLLEDGTTIKTKAMIGCDGVHSRVAQWLGLPKPISSGRSAIRALAVFPDGHGFPNEYRTYLDNKGIKVGFVPLNKTELYWFVVHKTSTSDSQDPDQILQEVIENLQARNFPDDILTVVKYSDSSSLIRTPLLLRTPWDILFCRAHRWNVTVAGDALHPMTPDMAQGGCTSLEDAVVLAHNVFSGTQISDSGFARYLRERQWRTACLTGSAYLAGWTPQDNRPILNWFMAWFIKKIFIRFVFPKMRRYAICYECGDLPTIMEKKSA
ncbi:FAD/NAD(P)-binding oxidoreductase family protein [Rhynchospora pubera]|uniref:FAD/NAD(P)-binding oxidoreductase family protein n=1 Tax=Rhynchospora pubera TaxID=906938 RepID=A0AAV8H3C4_9POAL|nr:FAD/NAD(P)-binding oxidoreductase family protein [Rhynchospora pubera]